MLLQFEENTIPIIRQGLAKVGFRRKEFGTDMGLATMPSPSDGLFMVFLVNTASSIAVVKEMLRMILRLVGIHLPSSDEDPCLEAWSGQSSGEQQHSPKSYTQQLIEEFRTHCPAIRFKVLARQKQFRKQECSVCLTRFKPEVEIYKLECGHVFHKACLEKWIDYWNTTCPLCRTPLMSQTAGELEWFN